MGGCPENVVSLTVFVFGSRGGFVVEGVLISTFVKCFLVRRGGFVEWSSIYLLMYLPT